jgi:Holliday junction resolvasome RuvABC endonuclease subunit
VIILEIDPGNRESGYAIIEMPEFKIRECGKVENRELLKRITEISITGDIYEFDSLAIEMVASYGMAVGKDVFETCVWSGRFI